MKRRRIGLTMKLNDVAPSNTATRSQAGERVNNNGAKGSEKPPVKGSRAHL